MPRCKASQATKHTAFPLYLNVYLLTRPDRADPAIDFVEVRRRVFPALLSHL